jgi:hypothetical protein
MEADLNRLGEASSGPSLGLHTFGGERVYKRGRIFPTLKSVPLGSEGLIDPERWKRIAEVYHAAAARAPGQRDALLDVACSDDDALRREVQLLLAVSTVGAVQMP